MMSISTNVLAGDYNKNEQYIIEHISGEEFSDKLEQRYVNQLKNYFYQEDVNLEKIDAEDFVVYLKAALTENKEITEGKADFEKFTSFYQNFQKAGTAIGLLAEYDSSVNSFYLIDESGYIVIDVQKVIKDTSSVKKSDDKENSWNISIEMIFAIAIILCILGIIANLRRWNRKMKRHSDRNYDDDEDDDELEIANRKTRRARLQTFSYKNIKQILRYFYIPIIMGLLVVGVLFAFVNMHSDFIDSVRANFINTQPLYNSEAKVFAPAQIKEDSQPKTMKLSDVVYPKYGEQYGLLECKKLKVNAPVYMGDKGSLLTKGAGTYLGSAIPGMGGTVLIGAHDTTYFSGLEKVQKGDTFKFTTGYGVYGYKVTDTKIVNEDNYDNAYDLNSDREQLVLYTCYPFGKLNGTKTDRMFVYLDKTDGPDIIY